jgi:hypothetical protein
MVTMGLLVLVVLGVIFRRGKETKGLHEPGQRMN